MATGIRQRHYSTAFVRLHACEPLTLEEAAQVMGCSRERIRQIEAKALGKAAAILAERGLELQDLLGDGVRESGMVSRRFHRSE